MLLKNVLETPDRNVVDIYYSNFSKFIFNENTSKKQSPTIFSYSEWKSNPNNIERTKLAVLKTTLKHYGKPVSGNKHELIYRLTQHYLQNNHATTIQRIFRGFLVRESDRTRGPALINRTICNNKSDFNTMELVTELDKEVFFSYKDHKGFVYGFNIFSLILMFERTRKLTNPYNREDIPIEILQNVFSLYKKMRILYPNRTTMQ